MEAISLDNVLMGVFRLIALCDKAYITRQLRTSSQLAFVILFKFLTHADNPFENHHVHPFDTTVVFHNGQTSHLSFFSMMDVQRAMEIPAPHHASPSTACDRYLPYEVY